MLEQGGEREGWRERRGKKRGDRKEMDVSGMSRNAPGSDLRVNCNCCPEGVVEEGYVVPLRLGSASHVD